MLDRTIRHIAPVSAAIQRKHARQPEQNKAILGEVIFAMISTLPFDLCGLQLQVCARKQPGFHSVKVCLERCSGAQAWVDA
ncbi:hypothetical protein [Puniceibacterium confluentis]|uniref:hypothetical protein n=1 Tax=Puniceibacterium confluentis TaxID=1958944 RepID=UPI0011B57084|nr:hypothetical protein [Puniceibacterium confluentis]